MKGDERRGGEDRREEHPGEAAAQSVKRVGARVLHPWNVGVKLRP
jgi:hypothetical protein